MLCNCEKTAGAWNYQNYAKETLEKAAFLVKTKQISLRKAVQEFGIPKSTIDNKVKGKHQKKSKRANKAHRGDWKYACECNWHIRSMENATCQYRCEAPCSRLFGQENWWVKSIQR